MYLSAENGGGSVIVANRPNASSWETFKLWRIDSTHFQLRVSNNQFMGLEAGVGPGVVAEASTPGDPETFEIVRSASDLCRVRIRASNGSFLQVTTDGSSVTADSSGDGDWGEHDPSVFSMTKVGGDGLRGEYQLTNGLGPDRAPGVMTEHWQTFIGKEDFQFMKEKGLDAVRIPVGWWIEKDANPPAPFVGGSLGALDNAFEWAGETGLKVIIDVHAVPGSQNGYEHSGTRDGSLEWGATGDSIRDTVAVVDFLAGRYAGNDNLVAVELLNEPARAVKLETLLEYYQAGYDAVRKHTDSALIIMSARVGVDTDSEILAFAGGFEGTVLDVHYYNVYDDSFKNMTAQQNIDYVLTNRSHQLDAITNSNGRPLTFVGEWSAALDEEVRASVEDYQNFSNAQLDVFGRASFGWAYWTYTGSDGPWSLKWMIQNDYISLL